MMGQGETGVQAHWLKEAGTSGGYMEKCQT